ncbi:hypothetical protein CBS101457_003134 [Exobasidium rhododendri]|nr:hypothetical protein CBS101457_003134 [Exobasidium rhododendri]
MASGSIYYELVLPPTDALPYYDNEIDKVGMRSKVDREIAKEMKEGPNGKVADDRLPPPIEVFQNRPELAEMLERAGKGIAVNVLDRSRYQLSAPDAGSDATDAEWAASLRNAEAQLMQSENRLTNLELLKKYGSNSWRLHNFQQEAFLRQYQNAATNTQSDTTSLNRTRKQTQTEAGNELTRLSKRWADLLNRSLNVEFANFAMMGDIQALEARKKQLQKLLNEAE